MHFLQIIHGIKNYKEKLKRKKKRKMRSTIFAFFSSPSFHVQYMNSSTIHVHHHIPLAVHEIKKTTTNKSFINTFTSWYTIHHHMNYSLFTQSHKSRTEINIAKVLTWAHKYLIDHSKELTRFPSQVSQTWQFHTLEILTYLNTIKAKKNWHQWAVTIFTNSEKKSLSSSS